MGMSHHIGSELTSAAWSEVCNELIHRCCSLYPENFVGVCQLPQSQGVSPANSIAELERCVKELGFRGALVNGFSQAGTPETCLYYDLPQYWGFWETLQKLDVPFYLHPRNPIASWAQIYDGHPWLMGPTWAFGQETAVHALRLMGSGLFDAYPRLKIVVGHMGEGLPFSMWRVDNRNAWAGFKPKYKAKKPIADYFHQNFWLTTSGNFRTQTLIDAMLEVSADRIRGFLDGSGHYAEPLAGVMGRMDGTPDVLRVIARRLAHVSAAAASPTPE